MANTHKVFDAKTGRATVAFTAAEETQRTAEDAAWAAGAAAREIETVDPLDARLALLEEAGGGTPDKATLNAKRTSIAAARAPR